MVLDKTFRIRKDFEINYQEFPLIIFKIFKNQKAEEIIF